MKPPFLFLLAVMLSGCVSQTYLRTAVDTARQEEREKCDRWLSKVANREITPREAKKLSEETK
jgi:hypothetical protein